MEQPKGFVQHQKGRLVCKLKKSLYVLRQSPRKSYKKFDAFMVNQGYTRSEYDHCLYFKRLNDIFIILVLYVDDILIVSRSMDKLIGWRMRWLGILIWRILELQNKFWVFKYIETEEMVSLVFHRKSMLRKYL